MRSAFKEWAVVVNALGRGEQILILRKGGLAEGPGGFQVEQREFLLLPTRFHQQRERVLPAAQLRYDELAAEAASAETVRLRHCAEVVAWHKLTSLADAERLRGQHIWRDEVIAERFDWGREQAIFALALRVRRLPETVELPLLPAYAGCKSWIELAESIPVAGAESVLTDADFAGKLAAFHAALATNA